jgi:hypothetical protein
VERGELGGGGEADGIVLSPEKDERSLPMNKVEYSDIYKFITSVGLLLIGLSLVVPYMILRWAQAINHAGSAQSDIEELYPAFEIQLQLVINLSNGVYYLSGFLLFLGLVLVSYGIICWRKRQLVIDAIQEEELKSRTMENISREGKKEIIKNEIIQSMDSIDVNNPPNEIIEKYVGIENGVYKKMAASYKANYEVLQNMQIGRFTYDILLKSRFTYKRGDIIVEVKYYSNKISLELIRQDTVKFIEAVKYYEVSQQRRSGAVFLIVHDGGEQGVSHSQITEIIQEESQRSGKPLRVLSTSALELLPLTAPQILGSAK